MKRARPDDTQPMRWAARTDPGGFRPPEPTARAADAERERMEQLIAAFDRAPKRPSPNYTERYGTTVSAARETKARRSLWLAVGGSAALAVVGIASVRSGSSSVAPAIRASGAETASFSAAASSASRTALPMAAPLVEQSPAATAPSLQAPSTNASPPIHAHPESAIRAVKHAPPAPAKPANDPTLDELDRVP